MISINSKLGLQGVTDVGAVTTDAVTLANLGIGGIAPSATMIVTADTVTSSAFNRIFSGTLIYTGTSVSMRALSFNATHQGSNAATPTNMCTSTLDMNAASGAGAIGFQGTGAIGSSCTISSAVNISVAGVIGIVGSNANSHSAATFLRRSVWAKAVPALVGSATDVSHALLVSDDMQVNTGKKLILEGTDGTKGDSYFIFETTTNNKIQTFIDGTNAMDVRAASINSFVDVKLQTAGNGFYVKEGTNATMGTANLVAGTVVVNTTKVTANSRIFLTANGGTLTNIGSPYVSARTAGTSFTIKSTNVLDAATIDWLLVEPS